MIISVLPNLSNAGVEKLARDVFNTLNKFDTEIYVSDEYKEIFSNCRVCYTNSDNLVNICDVAIAIGGDGTTLNVAKKAAQLNKHILGINAGRLGFMSGLEKDELSLLERVVYSDYEIDECLRLTWLRMVILYQLITALMISLYHEVFSQDLLILI